MGLKSVYDLLASRARETPGGSAVLAPRRLPLTYGHLHTQIRYVGSVLQTVGVERNDRVAVLLPMGPDAALACLGVASVAACAPLDPRCRADELRTYLSELRAKAVIVPAGLESPVIGLAREIGIAVLKLAPVSGGEAGVFLFDGYDASRDLIDPLTELDDLAFVLRTSGTTGRSKFVPLTNANVVATAHRVQASFELSANDRYLNVTPLFYSQGMLLTLSSLGAGGSVVCAPEFSAALFFDWVEEFRPTWYSAAPAIHQAILAYSGSDVRGGDHHRWRFIRSAAAPLPPQIREQLEGFFDSPVIESYGMTECYPISNNPLPPGRRKSGSAGLAAGTEVAVLDNGGNLLPPGDIGEIAVRGPHVTRGYLNEEAGDRAGFERGSWFRTGDQGYIDPDGYLFVSGRIKDVINRGGEKIAPSEIDEVLLCHPAVVEAAAFPVPHATLGEEIAAAVVLCNGVSVRERDIQAFASDRLSAFKVPRHVVFVNELPRTGSGKVQRSALAEKYNFGASGQAPDSEAVPVSAYSPVQRTLLDIWMPLLAMGAIGLQDNFFDLGGNSLLAIQLVAQIDKVFGTHLPRAVLFQAPTIEELSKALMRESWPRPFSSLVPIQPHGSRPPFFWVHGETSTALLAKHLVTDQPLYALEHQSHDGSPARHTTVEAIASHYLDEIRAIQPAGPYRLGGFSFGGTLAFEMAQQLKTSGEEVDLLLLLDSHFPGREAEKWAGSDAVKRVGVDVRRHLRHLVQRPLREQWTYVVVRAKNRLEQSATKFANPFRSLRCRLELALGRTIPPSLLSHYLLGIYAKARVAYEPRRYSGRVIYVKSRMRSGRHRASWASIISEGLECLEIPGDHLDAIKQPYVHLWAEKLTGWLSHER